MSDSLLTEKVQDTLEPVENELQSRLSEITLAGEEIETELRLTGSHCAPVSIAIQYKLAEKGIDSEVVSRDLTQMRRNFPGLAREHCIVKINDTDLTLIVDGTYLQMLNPFGLDMWLAHDLQRLDLFPTEKILITEASEVNEVSLRMVETVKNFWNEIELLNRNQEQALPMRRFRNDLTTQELIDYFNSIWNLSEYSTFKPTKTVLADAAILLETQPEALGYELTT